MTIRRSIDGRFPPGVRKRWLLVPAILLGLALLVPPLFVFIALRLPASVLQAPVLSLASGQVRFALPSGQVRAGRAELWVRDSASRDWLPWMPIDWTLNPAWRDTGPALVLSTGVGSAILDRSGLTLGGVRIGLPPGLLLASVDHPLAKAPWRGDIVLTSQRFVCGWPAVWRDLSSCAGAATLHWLGMGSSILPLQEYGDYVVVVSALGQGAGGWRADVSTEAGIVTIDGFVEATQGKGRYQLSIRSEKQLIEGLNSIAGPLSRKRGEAGEYILDGAW